MNDLKEWLAGLGLGRHAAAFLEQGIGADVLLDLTDADLKELGLNLGGRKRLLKAIAAFEPGRGHRIEPLSVPRGAERRQLTVMFVDVVGSTALAARLDPEDRGELLKAFQGVVAGEVTRVRGHVAKLAVHAAVANTFTICHHLISATTHRQFRTEAFAAWREATELAA